MASISVVWPICSPGARDSTGSPSSSTENTPITSPSTEGRCGRLPIGEAAHVQQLIVAPFPQRLRHR